MAPRAIDDRAALIEIAIEHLCYPHAKFAATFRAATSRVPAHRHSDDSAGRRLQRKFNRDKTYWLQCGRQEIENRREARNRQLFDHINRTAERMRPIMEAANAMMERYRPSIEAMYAQFNSVALRQALENCEAHLSAFGSGIGAQAAFGDAPNGLFEFQQRFEPS